MPFEERGDLIPAEVVRHRAVPPDRSHRELHDRRHLALHPYEPGEAAITILSGIPRATGHLQWIAGVPGAEGARKYAVAALCDEPEAAPWLMRHAMSGPDDWSGNALPVARAIDLPRALREHGDEPAVVRNAAHILLSAPRIRTGRTRGGRLAADDGPARV